MDARAIDDTGVAPFEPTSVLANTTVHGVEDPHHITSHMRAPTDKTFKSSGWRCWIRAVYAYIRDFSVEHTDYKRETAVRPGVPPMRLLAFDGNAAILQRRVKFNELRHPIMRLYKCVDLESAEEMLHSGQVSQQADDLSNCVVTSTDMKLNQTLMEQFSDDESRCCVFIVDASKLLDDGWIPAYDRGYVYWYPPITPDYIYGAPEFSIHHMPEECNDFCVFAFANNLLTSRVLCTDSVRIVYG